MLSPQIRAGPGCPLELPHLSCQGPCAHCWTSLQLPGGFFITITHPTWHICRLQPWRYFSPNQFEIFYSAPRKEPLILIKIAQIIWDIFTQCQTPANPPHRKRYSPISATLETPWLSLLFTSILWWTYCPFFNTHSSSFSKWWVSISP